MTNQPALPGWLKPANRVVVLLERLGVPLGTMHVLSVPGRRSGKMRTTPVSLLSVDGERYLVGGMITADWVRNARAAGWGILRYGRRTERVGLVELPEEERALILRAFPRLVPQGVRFFQRLYGLPADATQLPEAFAALAPRTTVFHLDTPPAGRL